MSDWSVERTAAVWFVALAPFALLATVAISWYIGLRPQRTLFPLTFWFWATVQAVVFGCAIAFWIHLTPCLIMACDLGPKDNAVMRGILWFGLWPVISIALILPCCFGRGYGLLERGYKIEEEY